MLLDGTIPEGAKLDAENVLLNNKEYKASVSQSRTYDLNRDEYVMINRVVIERGHFGNIPFLPEIESVSFSLVLRDAEGNELARSEVVGYTF